MTPDEKFMIRVYDAVGGQVGKPVDVRNFGLKESALKNTLKLLAQANLIVKIDECTISLTSRGLANAELNKENSTLSR